MFLCLYFIFWGKKTIWNLNNRDLKPKWKLRKYPHLWLIHQQLKNCWILLTKKGLHNKSFPMYFGTFFRTAILEKTCWWLLLRTILVNSTKSPKDRHYDFKLIFFWIILTFVFDVILISTKWKQNTGSESCY